MDDVPCALVRVGHIPPAVYCTNVTTKFAASRLTSPPPLFFTFKFLSMTLVQHASACRPRSKATLKPPTPPKQKGLVKTGMVGKGVRALPALFTCAFVSTKLHVHTRARMETKWFQNEWIYEVLSIEYQYHRYARITLVFFSPFSSSSLFFPP